MDLDKIVADIAEAVQETRETKISSATQIDGVSTVSRLSEYEDQLLQLAIKIKEELGDEVTRAFSKRLEYATWKASTQYCHPGEVGEGRYY